MLDVRAQHAQLGEGFSTVLLVICDSLLKVADAVFKWEKYAASTHSQKELKLTFKKRLFSGPTAIPDHPIEFDLVFHQVSPPFLLLAHF